MRQQPKSHLPISLFLIFVRLDFVRLHEHDFDDKRHYGVDGVDERVVHRHALSH
jgi:hypothetical protein